MRILLSLFFMLPSLNIYAGQLDSNTQVPWEVGDVIMRNAFCPGAYYYGDICYVQFQGVTEDNKILIQRFFDTGKKNTDPYTVLTVDGVYHDRSNESIDGPFKAWFGKGNIWIEGYYKNGKREGIWTDHYYHGQITNKGPYKNGVKEGLWTYWHYKGPKADEGSYLNDKEHGIWISWHENGQKKSEGSNLNGHKQGLWTFWDATGKKVKEKLYEDDQCIKETRFNE